MKQQQPKPQPETAKPAAQQTQPQPAAKRRSPTAIAVAAEFINRARPEDVDAFVQVLDRYLHHFQTFNEAAWSVIQPEPMCEEYYHLVEHGRDLSTIVRMFNGPEWLAMFLQTVASIYRERGLTAADVLFLASQSHYEVGVQVNGARELLRHDPEAIAAEIREAVQKRPELLQEPAR